MEIKVIFTEALIWKMV